MLFNFGISDPNHIFDMRRIHNLQISGNLQPLHGVEWKPSGYAYYRALVLQCAVLQCVAAWRCVLYRSLLASQPPSIGLV